MDWAQVDLQVTNDGRASEQVLFGDSRRSIVRHTEILVFIEESNVKIAAAGNKPVQELLYCIRRVQKLQPRLEVDLSITEAMEQQGLAMDQKSFAACEVAHEINTTTEKFGIPLQYFVCGSRLQGDGGAIASHIVWRLKAMRWTNQSWLMQQS